MGRGGRSLGPRAATGGPRARPLSLKESHPEPAVPPPIAGSLAAQALSGPGGTTDQAAKARFEDRQLLEQFQEVERLPDHDKALVKSFLDAFLFKRKVEGMTAR